MFGASRRYYHSYDVYLIKVKTVLVCLFFFLFIQICRAFYDSCLRYDFGADCTVLGALCTICQVLDRLDCFVVEDNENTK